jgi:hypothetical protein
MTSGYELISALPCYFSTFWSFGSVMNSNVWDSEASAQAYWTIHMGSQSSLGLAAAMN